MKFLKKKKFLVTVTLLTGAAVFISISTYLYQGMAIGKQGEDIGSVYKRGDGYYIKLRSGTRLFFSRKENRVRLFDNDDPQPKRRFCQFLMPWDRGEIDLRVNEGFAKQTPIVENGIVELYDPMKPKSDGKFSFSF